MSADSRPSLNIIENEVENAKEGAITPVPVTNLSDSSNPFLISTIFSSIKFYFHIKSKVRIYWPKWDFYAFITI